VEAEDRFRNFQRLWCRSRPAQAGSESGAAGEERHKSAEGTPAGGEAKAGSRDTREARGELAEGMFKKKGRLRGLTRSRYEYGSLGALDIWVGQGYAGEAQ